MGNALRHLVRKCFQPGQGDNDHDQSLGPHGVSVATVGVSALARDLFHFDNTAQVPDRLSKYVVSSKKAQANWYSKLLAAWKQAKTSPKTPQAASRFITETLKRHKKDDVLGLIAFYGLPISEAPVSAAPVEVGQATHPTIVAGLKFEIITLPVDAKSVSDGDTITVYVDTKDPRESSLVPKVIHDALIKRTKERLKHNYVEADVLQKQIIDAGYRIIRNSDRDILAKKYRIRLRGIDAPESSMPYGAEAKEALCNLVEGNILKIFIYDKDQYGRYVGDIYCHGTFVQEFMLKKGLAWHYIAYDKRPQLTKWENEARAARIGLWAAKDPEKPWEWRRDQKRG